MNSPPLVESFRLANLEFDFEIPRDRKILALVRVFTNQLQIPVRGDSHRGGDIFHGVTQGRRKNIKGKIQNVKCKTSGSPVLPFIFYILNFTF